MDKKNITLRVNKDLYRKYKQICKFNGLIVSRRFEIFMQGDLTKLKQNKL